MLSPHSSLRLALGAAGVLLCLEGGCKKYDPLFCDANHPCTDPERPFCDLQGDYPASEGIAETCIPDPLGDTAGTEADAGMDEPSPDSAAEPDPQPERIVQVATGFAHSCALSESGRVRCWGEASSLGYDAAGNVGDNEHPSSGQDVPLDKPAIHIDAGARHTCALTRAGEVVCWGENESGQLGTGEPGTNTPPTQPVDLGGKATFVAAGGSMSCAILDGGEVRCWGSNASGRLGLGFDPGEPVGDDEPPSDFPNVELAGPARAISCDDFCCAILEGGGVSCWGRGGQGQMALGNNDVVGDDETPLEAGLARIGDDVAQLSVGDAHACAVTAAGGVRCWGVNSFGESGLGLGFPDASVLAIGDADSEIPLAASDVGGSGRQAFVDGNYSCAVLTTGEVRCWGSTLSGKFGDDEKAFAAPLVEIGAPVIQAAAADSHRCVLTAQNGVRCWGSNESGQLGYGTPEDTVGDDESPASLGNVRVFEEP